MKMRSLVVFDINGILALKNHSTSGKKWRFFPEARRFLEKVYRYHDIAIWTSTTQKNAERVISHYFTKFQPVFVWYRDSPFTLTDPDHGLDPEITSFDTIKNLSFIKSQYPEYNKIMIIDDDYRKVRFNSPTESVVVKMSDYESPSQFYNHLLNKV